MTTVHIELPDTSLRELFPYRCLTDLMIVERVCRVLS